MALRQALLDIAPLRDSPGFRRLWIGRTLSGFGGQIAVVAVMFQVWQTTHSAVWTGAIGMARAVPRGTAASVLSGTFTRLPRPGLVMLGGSAVWGASLALFGLVSDPWIGLGFLVVAGAADTVAVVSRSAIVQLHTPNGLLGRVAAAELMVGQAGPDVGNMRAGIVAGHTSGPTALVSGGLLCLAAVVAIWVSTPALRHTTVGANTGDTRRASPDPV